MTDFFCIPLSPTTCRLRGIIPLLAVVTNSVPDCSVSLCTQAVSLGAAFLAGVFMAAEVDGVSAVTHGRVEEVFEECGC